VACDIYKHDVLALAPQLSTLNDAAWVMILAFVNTFEGLDLDLPLRKLALCMLAAHLAVVASDSASSGATTAVISESAGGLKRTYAQPTASSTSSSELERTNYGQQFLAITKMSPTTRGPRLI
jgi:hypothetical protein